jgi:hypothetical protein
MVNLIFPTSQGTAAEISLETIQRLSLCSSQLGSLWQRSSNAGTNSDDTRDAQELLRDADRLLVGLAYNWQRTTPTIALANFPKEYATQLIYEAAACETIRRNIIASRSVNTTQLRVFAKDIAAKVEDCKQNRMGRLVPIEIRVGRDSAPEVGWTVFYKWLPGDPSVQVRELSFPAPTPQAIRSLPPGLYAIRAQKAVNQKLLATEAETVPISGKDKLVWWISTP